MSSVREIQSFLGKLEVAPNSLPALGVDPDAASAIPVQHGFFERRMGVVRGHWQREDGKERPDHVYLLPDGASVDVPPGKAVRVLLDLDVLGREKWTHLELAGGGKLIGPLVWGWEEARDGLGFVHEFCKKEYDAKAGKSAVMFGLGCLAATACAAYAATTTLNLAAGMGTAFFGLIGTILGALIRGEHVQARLKRNERRQPHEVADSRHRRLTFALPEELEAAFDEVAANAAARPKPAFGADGLDEDTRNALAGYRHAVKLVEQRAGLSGAEMKMIRHSASMIGEIASRFRGSQNLKGDADLLQSFRALIRRAQTDVDQALIRDRVEESQAVQADIDTLMQQMEMRSSA